MGLLLSKQIQEDQPQIAMSTPTPPNDQLPPTEPPPVQLSSPEPRSPEVFQLEQDDDPFSQDDDFFSSLQITQFEKRPTPVENEPEPSPKRIKLNESEGSVAEDVVDGSNPFGDSDDDDMALCEIADALEDSMEVFGDELFPVKTNIVPEEDEHEKGVPVENRFKTSLGRPHPLLIPDIYEEILSYLTTPSSIKSARHVCTSWKDAVNDNASEFLTLRNVSHVTQKYPYGLGFSGSQKQLTTPFQSINVTRILVADPCIVFNKPEVAKFFKTMGSQIKYLGFDANLWCEEHWKFISNVLQNWCENLEELELIGVTCFDALAVHSGLNSYKMLKLNLRKLTVTWEAALERDHFHYSTVTKCRFNHHRYMMNRLHSRRDGGLIGKILRSSSNLTELTINFDFHAVSTYLMHVRVMDANFRNIQKLELIGTGAMGVDSMTFRLLIACQVRLVTFVAGPVEPNVEGRVIQNFLVSQASSLEHFELRGVNIKLNDGNRHGRIRFNVPEMPLLRVFKITDVSRFRFGNLSFAYRCPGLTTLELGTKEVHQNYKTGVFRYITRLFISREEQVFEGEHFCLREFKLTGCYASIVNHLTVARLFTRVFNRVESVGVACGRSVEMVQRCLNAWKLYDRLVSLDLSVLGDGEAVDFGVVSDRLREFRGLRNVGLFMGEGVPLRLSVVEEWVGEFYKLEFDRIIIHDEEAASIATHLARRNNYTVFKNLRIYKAGYAEKYDYAKRKHVDINQVTLTLVNLPVLVQQTFKVI